MEIRALMRKSDALTRWIYKILQNGEVAGDSRSRFAVACFDLALERREALVLLVAQNLYGAAFALVRSVWESYVRGLWLYHCASDAEVEAFAHDSLATTWEEWMQAIEKIAGDARGVVSRLQKQGWKAMHNSTHSGYQQVIRRMKEDTIALNYAPEEIVEIVECTNALGLLCVLQIAFLSTDEQLPMNVLEKARSFVGVSGTESVV